MTQVEEGRKQTGDQKNQRNQAAQAIKRCRFLNRQDFDDGVQLAGI